MNVWVDRMRCTYRVFPGQEYADPGRLDRLAQSAIAERLTDVLSETLGSDPSVYVLRQVSHQTVIGTELTDGQITSQWGGQIASAVVRHIAYDLDDGETMIRFASQAEYIAKFIADCLNWRVEEHWYYFPFSALYQLTLDDVLQTLLPTEREHFPALLVILRQMGVLDRLLAALSRVTLEQLWKEGLDATGPQTPDREALRSLFAVA